MKEILIFDPKKHFPRYYYVSVFSGAIIFMHTGVCIDHEQPLYHLCKSGPLLWPTQGTPV